MFPVWEAKNPQNKTWPLCEHQKSNAIQRQPLITGRCSVGIVCGFQCERRAWAFWSAAAPLWSRFWCDANNSWAHGFKMIFYACYNGDAGLILRTRPPRCTYYLGVIRHLARRAPEDWALSRPPSPTFCLRLTEYRLKSWNKWRANASLWMTHNAARKQPAKGKAALQMQSGLSLWHLQLLSFSFSSVELYTYTEWTPRTNYLCATLLQLLLCLPCSSPLSFFFFILMRCRWKSRRLHFSVERSTTPWLEILV